MSRLKGPDEQPDTPGYKQQPGDAFVKAIMKQSRILQETSSAGGARDSQHSPSREAPRAVTALAARARLASLQARAPVDEPLQQSPRNGFPWWLHLILSPLYLLAGVGGVILLSLMTEILLTTPPS
jgi:hypothetical protein